MKNILLKLNLLLVLIVGMINIIKADSSAQTILNDNAFLTSVAKSYYPSDSVNIFISKSEFAKGDTIRLLGIDKLPIPYTCHVIFVDLHPKANWGHECEYMLLATDTQQSIVIKKDMPPMQLSKFFTIIQQQKYESEGLIIPKYNLVEQEKEKNRRAKKTATTHNKYAVIISGGGDVDNNYVRYWNDCSAMYQTLIANGYHRSNIFVAMSDGTSPDYDLNIGFYHYTSSPLDLDGDGNNDIQYAANYNNIEYIFLELAHQMTNDDDLFVFVTDHGGKDYNNSYIVLWGGGRLMDYDFAQMISLVHARTINILMEQCYSGGFIDDLSGMSNVVITTACEADSLSYALDDRPYDEFVYRWLSGINGFVPSHTYPYYTDPEISNNADANNDGYVSMEEAFIYAVTYDLANEIPQLESHPSCLARSLALDDLLDLCDGSLLVTGWDLYMKDNVADLGEEPNMTTESSWISDDIWVEENGQRVDILQSGHTYDVCVRVRNRGVTISAADSATLYVHWAKAHIGGSWPWGWSDEYEYDCNGTQVRRGEMFGSVVLPQIEGGESYIARIQWETPLSAEYSACVEFDGDNLAELWHYCLLARIVDNQEQPDESITHLNLKEFVLNYNNVISRNITIMDVQDDGVSSPQLTGIVGLTNPQQGEDSGPYTLRCRIYGETNWENLATVRLTYLPQFYDLQQAMTWLNCQPNNIYGSFDLNDGAQFENLYFYASEEGLYPLKLEVLYYNTYDIGYYPEFTITIDLLNTYGLPVGGEVFRFRSARPDLANTLHSTSYVNKEELQDEVLDDVVSIDVYNIQGQFLKHSENYNIESLNLSPGIYVLKINTKTKSYPVKIIK